MVEEQSNSWGGRGKCYSNDPSKSKTKNKLFWSRFLFFWLLTTTSCCTMLFTSPFPSPIEFLDLTLLWVVMDSITSKKYRSVSKFVERGIRYLTHYFAIELHEILMCCWQILLIHSLLPGFQWYHSDKIWRNCCIGFLKIPDFSDILLQDVFSHGVAWSKPWINISSCSA